MTELLVNYIRKHVEEGKSLESIKAQLIRDDFPKSIVDSSMEEYMKQYGIPEPEKKESIFSRIFERKKITEEKPGEEKTEKPEIKGEKPLPEKPEDEEAEPETAKEGKVPFFGKIKIKVSTRNIRIVLIAAIALSVLSAGAFAFFFFDISERIGGTFQESEESSESIDCSESSLAVQSASWSEEKIELTVNNNGNVNLKGFTSIFVLKEYEESNVNLINKDDTVRKGDFHNFTIAGAKNCSNIERLTFRSSQCPTNAIHTIKQSEIQNCA